MRALSLLLAGLALSACSPFDLPLALALNGVGAVGSVAYESSKTPPPAEPDYLKSDKPAQTPFYQVGR